MAHRLDPGPVFAFEWITRSRRWQNYAIRGLFVLALLGGLGMVWRSATENSHLTTRQQLVKAGEQFFYTMEITQLALVLLAAPAATAGAICLDKARGTLAHVLVTDLTDREVVLGKLAARLVPVLNLIACALPVAALGTLMGGIDPVALTGSILIAVGLAALGCTLALALSVWMAKAHEVMVAVFAVWLLWMLALPIYQIYWRSARAPYWLEVTNPFWLSLAPYTCPGATSPWEPIGFLLACLVASGGLAALSVARVRPVYLRQANRVPKAVKDSRTAAWFRNQVRWWPGPSLDKNPVLWREWHRNRPSRVIRIVWGIYILLTSTFSLAIIWESLMAPNRPRNEMAALVNAFQVTIGLLLLAASAGTAMSEERVRGSLDVLLATPMPTHSIVWGKWWGAFRKVPWLAFWPTLVACSLLRWTNPGWMVALVYLTPALIIAQGAALAGLGLALATWITRTGRAVAWTISALVASVIGWPIVGFLVFSRVRSNNGELDWLLVFVMGSPFYNSAMPTAGLEDRGGSGIPTSMQNAIWVGSIVWLLFYATIAGALYLATLRTFDRCLGRMPEHPVGRTIEPKPSKAWVGELD